MKHMKEVESEDHTGAVFCYRREGSVFPAVYSKVKIKRCNLDDGVGGDGTQLRQCFLCYTLKKTKKQTK